MGCDGQDHADIIKKALPGRDFKVFIFMSHCTLPFIFFLFTDSFMLPIARAGQIDLMR